MFPHAGESTRHVPWTHFVKLKRRARFVLAALMHHLNSKELLRHKNSSSINCTFICQLKCCSDSIKEVQFKRERERDARLFPWSACLFECASRVTCYMICPKVWHNLNAQARGNTCAFCSRRCQRRDVRPVAILPGFWAYANAATFTAVS